MPVEEQVVVIFAGTRGYLDDVAVPDVKRFEAELAQYVRSGHGALLEEIRSTGLPEGLGDIVEAFKAQFRGGDQSGYAVDPTNLEQGEVGEAASTKTLATE
jgi:F-type H+-transporting ATPase subunit alpha